MKTGGADVRVIQSRAQDTECQIRLRQWVRSVSESTKPPDAFFAIAFWQDPEHPAGFDTTSSYQSDTYLVPYDLLPDLACATLKRIIISTAAERGTMRALGYIPDDDPAA